MTLSFNEDFNVTQGFDSDKLDTDLSNLSPEGKAVISGQWVKSYHALWSSEDLTNETNASILKEVDLSSYLPDDDYTYEVRIEYWLNATLPNAVGNNAVKTYLAHNYTSGSYSTCYLAYAMATKTSEVNISNPTIGSIVATVTPEKRKIGIGIYKQSYGNMADLAMREYRRLGTNN